MASSKFIKTTKESSRKKEEPFEFAPVLVYKRPIRVSAEKYLMAKGTPVHHIHPMTVYANQVGCPGPMTAEEWAKVFKNY